jgi:uncharacterized membrane protein (UPF0127 family)
MKTRRKNRNHTIKIKKKFKTLNAHRRGLMFVKNPLPQNTGALFTRFRRCTSRNTHRRCRTLNNKKRSKCNGYWMKNTYIPLDVIALNDKRRVIGMVHNMRPHSLKIHNVPHNTTYAIETNAGHIKRNHIKLGDRIIFGR